MHSKVPIATLTSKKAAAIYPIHKEISVANTPESRPADTWKERSLTTWDAGNESNSSSSKMHHSTSKNQRVWTDQGCWNHAHHTLGSVVGDSWCKRRSDWNDIFLLPELSVWQKRQAVPQNPYSGKWAVPKIPFAKRIRARFWSLPHQSNHMHAINAVIKVILTLLSSGNMYWRNERRGVWCQLSRPSPAHVSNSSITFKGSDTAENS